jgi:hypothetical protein
MDLCPHTRQLKLHLGEHKAALRRLSKNKGVSGGEELQDMGRGERPHPINVGFRAERITREGMLGPPSTRYKSIPDSPTYFLANDQTLITYLASISCLFTGGIVEISALRILFTDSGVVKFSPSLLEIASDRKSTGPRNDIGIERISSEFPPLTGFYRVW